MDSVAAATAAPALPQSTTMTRSTRARSTRERGVVSVSASRRRAAATRGRTSPAARAACQMARAAVRAGVTNDELASGGLPALDGGHDGDVVTFLEHGGLAIEEANVFLVHVHVDEAAQLTSLVHEATRHA